MAAKKPLGKRKIKSIALFSQKYKPRAEFKTWLVAQMARKGISIEKKRVQEYTHIYRRTKQLMPQMFDFVETIFRKRKAGSLNTQLVFLGRGARPFYRIAFRLGQQRGNC